MKTIKVYSYKEIPTNFTGIAEYANGDKYWYRQPKAGKEGKLHRLDGPAFEDANGYKEFWVDDKRVTEKDFHQAVLDYKLKMVLES